MAMLPLAPGETIGILGGGQLGRMLAQAASRLGFDVAILEPAPDAPAGRVAAHTVRGGLYAVGGSEGHGGHADLIKGEEQARHPPGQAAIDQAECARRAHVLQPRHGREGQNRSRGPQKNREHDHCGDAQTGKVERATVVGRPGRGHQPDAGGAQRQAEEHDGRVQQRVCLHAREEVHESAEGKHTNEEAREKARHRQGLAPDNPGRGN